MRDKKSFKLKFRLELILILFMSFSMYLELSHSPKTLLTAIPIAIEGSLFSMSHNM